MAADVLILGGGLTAWTAADEIIQTSEARVTMLSCGAGASPYIHGFCMNVGPQDGYELFLRDTLESGYHQSDPVLAGRLCAGTDGLQEYFAGLGLELDRDGTQVHLLHALGSTVPRIACIHNATGPALLSRLRQRLKASDRFTERSGLRALELIRGGGRVIGAKCYDETQGRFCSIYAGTVILATGGFGRLFPESTNSPDIGGDGCAMAYRAGAGLTDMEFIQFEPSAAVWPEQVAGKGIVTTMFYDGAVLRGADGERFMLRYSPAGERVSKDVLSKCIFRQIREQGATPHGGVWFDARAVPEEKWQGAYKPYLNRYLACGIDLRREPVEIAPAAHTTCGGVVIDGNCRTGVPGLIACGEVAGGLHGANRLGGNAGLETIVFGRIAGRTAVEDAQGAFTLPEDACGLGNTPPDVDIAAMRAGLRDVLRSSLNVIRAGQELEAGLAAIDALAGRLGDISGSYEKYRLSNDLLTARLALLSALERRSSVGCHCRSDAIKEPERYRIVIEERDGQPLVVRKPV